MSDGNAAMTAATVAAAEAEEQRQREQQEEEEMTNYSDAELQGDWEFKILRSRASAFARPEVLDQVREDEARAGWTLVEKFDDQRLRFKRPASAKAGDSMLDFDPYRTCYGSSIASPQLVIVATLVGLGVGLAVLFLILLMH